MLEMGLRLSSLNEYLSPEYRLGSLFDHCVFWKPEPPELNPLGIYHDHKKQFRGVYYEKRKPRGVGRIICLGGSSTWGWPLEDTEKIYPAVLEKMLNDHSSIRRFEVINAGVGGYSSFQAIKYLENSLLEYDPDIITICIGANDSNTNSDIHTTLTDKEYWQYIERKRHKPSKFGEASLVKLRAPLSNLRFYNAMDEILFRIRNEPKIRVLIENFKENMVELMRISKAYDHKVFLVTETHRNPRASVDYIEVLKSFGDRHENAFFVDTRAFLQDGCYFADEMHPTYEGHKKKCAKAIFDRLLYIGVLDTERGSL